MKKLLYVLSLLIIAAVTSCGQTNAVLTPVATETKAPPTETIATELPSETGSGSIELIASGGNELLGFDYTNTSIPSDLQEIPFFDKNHLIGFFEEPYKSEVNPNWTMRLLWTRSSGEIQVGWLENGIEKYHTTLRTDSVCYGNTLINSEENTDHTWHVWSEECDQGPTTELRFTSYVDELPVNFACSGNESEKTKTLSFVNATLEVRMLADGDDGTARVIWDQNSTGAGANYPDNKGKMLFVYGFDSTTKLYTQTRIVACPGGLNTYTPADFYPYAAIGTVTNSYTITCPADFAVRTFTANKAGMIPLAITCDNGKALFSFGSFDTLTVDYHREIAYVGGNLNQACVAKPFGTGPGWDCPFGYDIQELVP